MYLEVTCENKIGLTNQLLHLLALYSINLTDIRIDYHHKLIYLGFSEIDFTLFRELMAKIRRVNGVHDVKKIARIPVMTKYSLLESFWHTLSLPILSLDQQGKIVLANPAALTFFSITAQQLADITIENLLAIKIERLVGQQIIEYQNQHFPVQVIVNQQPTQNYTLIIQPQAKPNPDLSHNDAFAKFVTNNAQMASLIVQAKKFSRLDAPLLITGETGTGKDLLALACHHYSQRGKNTFLALNCAALPDEVAESELFGHAPGAYPNALEGKKGFFEQANGGSVLLDEIGEMSSRMQTKLLRFLNDGIFRRVGADDEVKVDVRVICATQKNLLELVKKGIFREDLYYRLNVLPLDIPALRERPQDIMLLTEYFVSEFAREQAVAAPMFSSELAIYLQQYPWPGNVRQLKNALYLAMSQLDGHILKPEHIVLPHFADDLISSMIGQGFDGTLDEMSRQFERAILTQLYSAYPSTRKLAKRLGLSHTAIANKLREHGLSSKDKSDS